MRTILVVDDDPGIRRLLERHFKRIDWNVISAESCREAIQIIESDASIQAVLCDLILPDGLGWSLGDVLGSRADRPPLVFMTGEGHTDNAIIALRHGATDFLVKPFSLQQVDDAIARSLTQRPMRGAIAREVKPIDHWRCENAIEIIGNDSTTLEMLSMARRVSETDSSVLITGESGTGKELVARAIHFASSRRLNPLVVLNCAAIPETLIESELFGHERGAFTGAITARQGHFAAAHTGTIFLDEIGELPLAMQSKLLRILQEREVTPLGSSKSVAIDTRVLAATNIDLEKAVEDGRFREDLFYRLNVIPIEVPPLRDRRSDIPTLAACFIDRYNKRLGCSVTGFAPGVLDELKDYDWPGNVRELENTIERMVVLQGNNLLGEAGLPARRREPKKGPKPTHTAVLPHEGVVLRDAVDAFERSLIQQALSRAGGNKSRAARILAVRRTTLTEKIKKLLPHSESEDELRLGA